MAERVRQLVIAIAVASLGAAIVPAPGAPARALTITSAYVPIGPLRLADTRAEACGCRRLDESTIAVNVTDRVEPLTQIVAAAVTLTATETPKPGFVTAYPAGHARPDTSTVNTRPDRVVANSTIVPVGADGTIAVYQLVPGDLIVDLTGVFVARDVARAGRFVPLAPARLVDTRASGGAALGANNDLIVPLPVGVDPDATALAINVTTLGEPAPSFLSVRPAGTPPTSTSFVNSMGTGRAIAAAVIAPVSADGLTIRTLAGAHVIVDVTGWFTGPSAVESSGGLFRPETPRRLFDSRTTSERLRADGTIEIPNPFAGAGALVANLTVTEPDRRGYVTAFPAGRIRPSTSVVNPNFWNHTVANLAISPVSTRGVAYWSLDPLDLIVDVTGSFSGEPVDAPQPPPPNVASRARVLMVGDSTLAAIDVFSDSQIAFSGFDPVVDAAPCRRLLRPSCLSNTTGRIPNTAVQAINGTPGSIDIAVIKTGYNDWFSDFPTEFAAVVGAARAKGAHTILWLTYNEDVSGDTPRRAYAENNADLRRLTASPAYDDVILADWLAYSTGQRGWFWDGIHAGRTGSYATTDYISRWIAAIEHRPCPRPWAIGGPTPDPCPPPDSVGAVPDPVGIWR